MSVLWLYVFKEETTSCKGGTEPGEKDSWIFGVQYSIPFLEPFGYKSEYSLSLKLFLFNLRDVLYSVMFIKPLLECFFTWLFFYSRYCNNEPSVTHKRKSVY